MINFKKLTDDLINLAVFVIIAMLLIFLVYEVAITLTGALPAQVGVIILSIAMAFIYGTNRKVRDTINSWIKNIRR